MFDGMDADISTPEGFITFGGYFYKVEYFLMFFCVEDVA